MALSKSSGKVSRMNKENDSEEETGNMIQKNMGGRTAGQHESTRTRDEIER